MSDDRLNRTRYDPAEVEGRIFALWEEAGVFHPEPTGERKGSYSIAVPPPNVTGSLHMGHALNGTLQDVLIRLARMRGRRAKWIYGTDHAGIATQRQVERALAEEGVTKEELGRERFVERVWQWREEHGSTITEQFKRLGASLDYEDERFTMDPAYAQAVVEVFQRLHEKGYIYRDNYMVNWDPGLRTAISDLEVEQRTVEDTLYMVDYPLESGSGAVTVATVRPETMLADTAIAVNPADERYSRLIGEAAVLPLVGRRLPILADEYVDPEFGTGALKITPGHDPNDFDIGRRHGLEEITVIGEDGRITDSAPEQFRGMEVEEARAGVVAALREEGLISGTRPYEHDVPHSHRSGRRIEPLISLQWFCDMSELAKPAIAAVRDGSLRFHPERPWTGVYLDWLENIRPWCISRQLWWGHQLPVWYRGDETHVGAEPPEGEGWERDPDVLDTWFSSGLWPFATLGWPEDNPELRTFYPTDALSTARDIIFLWVARMVMFGVELTGELPFTDVPIHSVVQAPDGRRMSKSLGTGIDPLQLIEGGERPPVYSEGGEFPAYGADALRFALMAMSSSQDVRFNEERVRQGRDLANKLWNASRLILTRVGRRRSRPAGHRDGGGPLDRVAVGAAHGERDRAARLLPVLARGARPLRRLLVGGVRLVPGAGQAEALRVVQRGRVRRAPARARADAPAAAPGDAVRDRGDLVAAARRARAPGRERLARARPGAAGPRRGGGHEPVLHRRGRPAELPRPGGRPAGQAAPRRARRRRVRRPRRPARPPGAVRSRGIGARGGGADRRPGRARRRGPRPALRRVRRGRGRPPPGEGARSAEC